ncbi:hypothetical protein QBC47DRAFT_360014 [Echria macrotheca]|uniref:Uncharacterized protein n=1 Tax=Echria macrotheca TaxID=438768 RepID=A0AAJ0F732_9PEZI|nr:hypothetical protein QBC47DRAFT_360014 [Echria macrotheca]
MATTHDAAARRARVIHMLATPADLGGPNLSAADAEALLEETRVTVCEDLFAANVAPFQVTASYFDAVSYRYIYAKFGKLSEFPWEPECLKPTPGAWSERYRLFCERRVAEDADRARQEMIARFRALATSGPDKAEAGQEIEIVADPHWSWHAFPRPTGRAAFPNMPVEPHEEPLYPLNTPILTEEHYGLDEIEHSP